MSSVKLDRRSIQFVTHEFLELGSVAFRLVDHELE